MKLGTIHGRLRASELGLASNNCTFRSAAKQQVPRGSRRAYQQARLGQWRA
jgi:hypothetical protein